VIIPTKRLAVLAFGFAFAVAASQASAQTRQDRDRQAYKKDFHDCIERIYPNSPLEVARYTRYTVCKSGHG
jgi:hypothetical protein